MKKDKSLEEETINSNEHECKCGCNNEEHECKCNEEGHTCSCGCEEHSCSCENSEPECREEEFKEILQRVQAEFENYRRRTENSYDKFKEDGIVYAINKLLPVLDSFKSAKALVTNEEFLNSLNLVEKQFIDGLSSLNITKIEADNVKFDPNLHNAVLSGTDESKEDETILEVYQDGYKLNNRVIRYSVVKINKLS